MSRPPFRTSVAVRAAAVLLLAPLATACTDPPANGMTGTALAYGDTGRSPYPITDGWIIAVPDAAVDDLWKANGNKPIDRQDPDKGSARLNRDLVIQAGGAVDALDDDGEFFLPTKAGEHLICQLVPAVDGGTDVVGGCAFLNLPVSGELKIQDGDVRFAITIKK